MAAMNRTISIAPMMDWTDRHDRYFLRLISQHALLYTEMVTADALIHGDSHRMLRYDAAEHPVALQLGGSDPDKLVTAAKMGEQYGYDEINLNVGCPSDRVKAGRFGACLMAEPQLVGECIAAMQAAVSIPVTVKTRIGIDRDDSYQPLHDFVSVVADHGCEVFIIHARKAWLDGLSPKENRDIPPLRYEYVHRLKAEFPQLNISINGGIKTLDDAASHLDDLQGVMIGREAYQNPYILAEVDQRFYGTQTPPRSRIEVVEAMYPYIEQQLAQGHRLNTVTRHILGLFQGQPGARAWRRHLSENAHKPNADATTVQQALRAILDAPTPTVLNH